MQLEREVSRCSRLDEVNRQLKEQLASLKSLSRNNERLERSKRQLEEEVTSLRRQVEAGLMDQSQAEQYRRETEERARQEIRHKLEEVNLFLQVEAKGTFCNSLLGKVTDVFWKRFGIFENYFFIPFTSVHDRICWVCCISVCYGFQSTVLVSVI